MLKEGKIGVFDATTIIIIMLSSKVLFTSTRTIVENLGPAAWYGTLISALTALAGFYLLAFLMDKSRLQELVPVFETAFGRLLGGLLLLVIGFLFTINAALFGREFVEAVKVFFYPLSPPSFILIIFILAVMALLYFGLEVITRCASLFFWPIVAAFVIIFVFAVPLYETANLFPFLGHGLTQTVLTGLTRSSVYTDVIALAVFAGSLQGAKNFKKAGVTALILSGLIIGASIFFYTMAFPYKVSAENTIPLLTLTREIEYGRFFQRFESIFLLAWSVSALLTAAISLYAALSIYCKAFRMDDHRVLVLPLAVIMFCLAIMPRDISSIAFIYVAALRQHSWTVQLGLPLLALFVAMVRGKKGGRSGA